MGLLNVKELLWLVLETIVLVGATDEVGTTDSVRVTKELVRVTELVRATVELLWGSSVATGELWMEILLV